MKKAIFALSLAAVVLMSGCSGVSQEKNSSIMEKNSSTQAEISSTVTINSSLESSIMNNESIEQSRPTTSETNNAKQDFLAKSKDLVSLFDKFTEISKYDDSDYYYVLYLCSMNGDNYSCAHFMFYTEDVNTVCDEISKEVQRLTEYYDEYGNWYDIYVNDKDNNHIVTIGNWEPQFSGNKLDLTLCWYNAEIQTKYKQLESSEELKNFTIKVIN